nr:hypothetical protein [Angustibacter aerolatus]
MQMNGVNEPDHGGARVAAVERPAPRRAGAEQPRPGVRRLGAAQQRGVAEVRGEPDAARRRLRRLGADARVARRADDVTGRRRRRLDGRALGRPPHRHRRRRRPGRA